MNRRHFVRATAGAGLLTSAGCATQTPQGPATAPAAGLVRLSSNENPLGLAPAARRAILENLGVSSIYPSSRQPLLDALAAAHGVTPEHIALGTGSTEILQMLVQSTDPGATMVIAEPTFEDVARYADAAGRRLVKVPLAPSFAHDLAAMRAAAGDGPALVFICNPNNPTGTLTPCDQVEEWIAAEAERVTFVIDEAYFEFATDAGYRTAIPWVQRHANVVVTRTFSKIYGMAGLRLGYAVGHPVTIARVRRLACQNNINGLALAAGLASLGDQSFRERTLAANRASRRILADVLAELELVALPSHTNFVMHRIRGDVVAYNQRMREAGWLLGRPFPPMTDYSRVSLGTPEDMRRFAETLREFRRRDWV